MDEKPLETSNWRRAAFVLLVTVALMSIIGATFYVQDYRYSLPTPRPADFVAVQPGFVVSLPQPDRRPTLLCFASPDCPCSRFNQDHVDELALQFGSSVRIIEVVEAGSTGSLTSPGETLLDPDGVWARQCGVYSTPQAVILDGNRHIVFSGNFNSTRFCSNPASQYARIALEALVAHRPVPSMPRSATTPYGCAIPGHGGAG